jgi:hypothetical protein
MRRVFRSAMLAAMVAVAVTAVSAAQQTSNTNKQVTLVMNGGERHTGTLVYHNDANLNLIENGQDKPYSMNDIAMVDFGAGDPGAAELNQLPTGDQSNDVNRHMLVLRDGTVVHGRMYTIKENAITVNTANGHQDFDLNNVSRWYVNPAAARSVYANILNSGTSQQTVGTTGQAVPAGAIQVNGNQAWTDSGITVRRGDRIAFSTTGQVAFRQGGNASDSVNADGSQSESRAGAPVQNIGVGGLIGRVGTGTPFAIGSNSQPITMPANGRLYLGINDAGVGDNSGAFVVTIVR